MKTSSGTKPVSKAAKAAKETPAKASKKTQPKAEKKPAATNAKAEPKVKVKAEPKAATVKAISYGKVARMEIRLPKDLKKFFIHASQLAGYKHVTEFIVTTVQQRAIELQAKTDVYLSYKDHPKKQEETAKKATVSKARK